MLVDQRKTGMFHFPVSWSTGIGALPYNDGWVTGTPI
jgi:hypothetical protein